MPQKNYFLTMAGAIVLGFSVMAVSVLIAILAFPFIEPYLPEVMFFAGATAAIVIVTIIVWIVIFFAAFIGIFIYYLGKPMNVEKKDKRYSLDKSKEAGKREKRES